MPEQEHISVLLDESIEMLDLKDGGVYVDLTFGAGGHTSKILESRNVTVIATDRDPYTKKFADKLKEKYGERFHYFNTEFSEFDSALESLGVEEVDGILMDLGFSSMQVDNAERGFSFSADGPLDMRMSQSGESAADFINNADEKEIADVIFKYGDERKSRQIARKICEMRNIKPISTTKELADVVAKVFGGYRSEIHPATRTFQAIRIYINQEFEQLERAMEKAVKHLKTGGVLAVISFHSGEDAIVKAFFNEKSGKNENFNRYLPENNVKNALLNRYLILSKKPIAPSESEVLRNVRARSAKLRGLKKL